MSILGNRHLYCNPMVAAGVEIRAGVFYSHATLFQEAIIVIDKESFPS